MIKRLFLTALLALPLLLSGCSENEAKNEPQNVYQVGIYPGQDNYVNRCGYDIKDNELYQMIRSGVKAINEKYDHQILASDDSEAMRLFDQAFNELKDLKTQADQLADSGKDFGACTFFLEEYCKAEIGSTPLKTSEYITFSYTPTYRIAIEDELNFNTEHAASESGITPVKVYDGDGKFEVTNWKIYDRDCLPSEADFIQDIEVEKVFEDGVPCVYFNFTFKAEQKKYPGDYYILVAINDKTDPEDVSQYDLMVNIHHKTSE